MAFCVFSVKTGPSPAPFETASRKYRVEHSIRRTFVAPAEWQIEVAFVENADKHIWKEGKGKVF